MSDLALLWNAETSGADLVQDGAGLVVDQGLKTAIIISLFTDRRARADDDLPQEGADRRGWWGDVAAAVQGDQIGSRLWLLRRSKMTAQVIEQAREYCVEALSWLIEDGVASGVEVTTSAMSPDILAIVVVVSRADGPTRQKFDFVWRPSSGVFSTDPFRAD